MNHKKLVGLFGEGLAAGFLERQGYKILFRNYKTSYKELDIIAIYEKILVFIEVKTRLSQVYGSAAEALTPQKLINLTEGVELFLEQNNLIIYDDLRIDLISVDLDRTRKMAKIKHYKEII